MMLTTTKSQRVGLVTVMCFFLAFGAIQANAADVALTREAQAAISPAKALEMLKEGNERFVSNKLRKRDLMAQVKKTGKGQFPFAAILSCLDSRTQPEYVFDQGIGDIFVARVAGNFGSSGISVLFDNRVDMQSPQDDPPKSIKRRTRACPPVSCIMGLAFRDTSTSTPDIMMEPCISGSGRRSLPSAVRNAARIRSSPVAG